MNKSREGKILELIQEEHLINVDEERDKIRHDAKEQIAKIQAENRKSYNKKKKNST